MKLNDALVIAPLLAWPDLYIPFTLPQEKFEWRCASTAAWQFQLHAVYHSGSCY